MGVHTLLLLAHDGAGRPRTSAGISGSTNTNPVVVRRLLCALNRAGLVQTQKGPRGGARLARGAEAITLGDVYRAVETAEPLNRPRARPNPKCPVGARMEAVLNQIFSSAQGALERELDHTSLAEFSVAAMQPLADRPETPAKRRRPAAMLPA